MSKEIKLVYDFQNRISYDGDMDFNTKCINIEIDDDNLEELIHDCETVFNCRGVRKGNKYSSGETYFIKANELPRCGMEKLALSIFSRHTETAEFDKKKSGAEWWCLVIDNQDDVGLHFDRDYGIEGELGLHVYPHLATVTYLSNIGGSTIVIDKRGTEDKNTLPTGYSNNIYMSKPSKRKHICFDGQLLHGAFNLCGESTARGKRVTFLVNIWLNHIPVEANRLPKEISKGLTLLETAKVTLGSHQYPMDTEMTAEGTMTTLHLPVHRKVLNIVIPVPKSERLEGMLKDNSIIHIQYSEDNRIVITERDTKRKMSKIMPEDSEMLNKERRRTRKKI